MTTPAILVVLSVFAAVLLLSRLKIPLGVALVLGGPALLFWSGAGPAEIATSFREALSSPDLGLLLVIISLILEFGRYLTKPQNAADIVNTARRWGGKHGRALTLISVPALIGLVPMPAGALFSAPLVQQAAGDGDSRPEWKTGVNYWFRHIWEFWWPLYPGVIVAMSVFEMETWQFMAAEILLTPVAVLAGYFVLIRPHLRRLAAPNAGEPPPARRNRVLLIMGPLFLTVLGAVLLPMLFARIAPKSGMQTRKLLAMLVGLAAGLALIRWDERKERDTGFLRTFLKKKSLNILLTVTGVMVFKACLEKSGLLPAAARDLAGSGIPAVFIIAFLPFLAGIVTGIAVGFTGTSFPLVVGLMNSPSAGLTPMATVVLAYGFGLTGMMLSPVHLCLLTTRDYFSATMLRVFRLVLPCGLLVAAGATGLHAVFMFLGW